jgi:predicted kinase
MARPLLVLVSGHPGSGKTTLGRALGDRMALPHLNRDRLRDGMSATDPASVDQPRTWQVFLDTIRLFLDNGISLVADQTLYLGMVDDLRSLTEHGDVVNVLCRCPNAYARWYAKVTTDPRGVGAGFDALVERVLRQRDEMANPLPLGVPVIEVETTDGYAPTLDELAALIADTRS